MKIPNVSKGLNRFFAMLLALAMVLSMVPTVALADEAASVQNETTIVTTLPTPRTNTTGTATLVYAYAYKNNSWRGGMNYFQFYNNDSIQEYLYVVPATMTNDSSQFAFMPAAELDLDIYAVTIYKKLSDDSGYEVIDVELDDNHIVFPGGSTRTAFGSFDTMILSKGDAVLFSLRKHYEPTGEIVDTLPTPATVTSQMANSAITIATQNTWQSCGQSLYFDAQTETLEYLWKPTTRTATFTDITVKAQLAGVELQVKADEINVYRKLADGTYAVIEIEPYADHFDLVYNTNVYIVKNTAALQLEVGDAVFFKLSKYVPSFEGPVVDTLPVPAAQNTTGTANLTYLKLWKDGVWKNSPLSFNFFNNDDAQEFRWVATGEVEFNQLAFAPASDLDIVFNEVTIYKKLDDGRYEKMVVTPSDPHVTFVGGQTAAGVSFNTITLKAGDAIFFSISRYIPPYVPTGPIVTTLPTPAELDKSGNGVLVAMKLWKGFNGWKASPYNFYLLDNNSTQEHLWVNNMGEYEIDQLGFTPTGEAKIVFDEVTIYKKLDNGTYEKINVTPEMPFVVSSESFTGTSFNTMTLKQGDAIFFRVRYLKTTDLPTVNATTSPMAAWSLNLNFGSANSAAFKFDALSKTAEFLWDLSGADQNAVINELKLIAQNSTAYGLTFTVDAVKYYTAYNGTYVETTVPVSAEELALQLANATGSKAIANLGGIKVSKAKAIYVKLTFIGETNLASALPAVTVQPENNLGYYMDAGIQNPAYINMGNMYANPDDKTVEWLWTAAEETKVGQISIRERLNAAGANVAIEEFKYFKKLANGQYEEHAINPAKWSVHLPKLSNAFIANLNEMTFAAGDAIYLKVRILEKMPEPTLTLPAYRTNFYPGEDASKVEGTVPAGMGLTVILEGNGIATQTATPGADGKFSFNTAGLPVGGQVRLSVVMNGHVVSETIIRRLAETGKTMTWIQDGVLYLNGEPVIRRNVYSPTYHVSKLNQEKYFNDDLSETDEMVQVSIQLSALGVEPYSDASEHRNLAYPSAEVLAAVDRIIEANKNKNFGYYYFSDEPEYERWNMEYMKNLYKYIAEKDPYHVILIGTQEPAGYIDCADWIEVDHYMGIELIDGNRVHHTSWGTNYGDLAEVMALQINRNRADKCFGFLPTCYATWPDYGNTGNISNIRYTDYPTFDEYICNTWVGLTHGAKSIWAYAGHDIHDRASLYEGTRYTFSSIEALEDLLATGTRNVLAMNDSYEAVTWTKGSEQMVVIINLKTTEQTVTVNGLSGTWDNFRHEGTFTGNTFTLKPLEVLIGTSIARDTGLKSYDTVAAEINDWEATRKANGSLLFGSLEYTDYTFNASKHDPSDTSRAHPAEHKLFDGVRDNYGWAEGGTGTDGIKFVAFNFLTNKPTFNVVKVYGINLGTVTLMAKTGEGEFVAVDGAVVNTEGNCTTITLPASITPDAIRLQMAFTAEANTQIYEVEVYNQ